MKIRKDTKQELNLLCIGESMAGKSKFLSRLTRVPQRFDPTTIYKVYAKRINSLVTYFHELSEQCPLYLQQKYDSVIFFVDLVSTLKAGSKILSWLQAYCECSSQQICNIPVQIIVMRAFGGYKQQKWRSNLQKQLDYLVEEQQIHFASTMEQCSKTIKIFCKDILQQKAKGVKESYKMQVKIYGIMEVIKSIWENIQRYFVFRGKEDQSQFFLKQKELGDNQSNSQNQNQSEHKQLQKPIQDTDNQIKVALPDATNQQLKQEVQQNKI